MGLEEVQTLISLKIIETKQSNDSSFYADSKMNPDIPCIFVNPDDLSKVNSDPDNRPVIMYGNLPFICVSCATVSAGTAVVPRSVHLRVTNERASHLMLSNVVKMPLVSETTKIPLYVSMADDPVYAPFAVNYETILAAARSGNTDFYVRIDSFFSGSVPHVKFNFKVGPLGDRVNGVLPCIRITPASVFVFESKVNGMTINAPKIVD